MKVLLDSHLLVWLVGASDRLPAMARGAIENPDNIIYFSSASIWELSIKHASGRARLALPPMLLYEKLIDNDFREVPVTAAHGLRTVSLPAIHKDPFDRILIAQAMSEEMILLTSDAAMAQYDAPVRLVL
ncbi:type II toxin-antitoxin system VapC family toxin [Neorhizobium alkalisoli]|uniref:PIN domain nuclease of toxin-antitoxin system n=1 Tax=Neorhizobium alkalisoli TaxID=528178 RepID=A0A561QRR1_9HYPH|nr:type II toxin-antitoxin system VapC family toxin [Neorhizobium alkalisoli]TWF53081.1 PIN domain nuclease of toxin-antitoxin system [Neorhizobium alkalisoli]